MMAARLVAVPDSDGELTHDLGRLEEVLLQLQPYEPDDDPAPLGLGADALAALQRILGAILAAERNPTAKLLASGGTFELIPLRFVDLDDGDLGAVGEAVAALGLALLPGGDEFAEDVLREFVDDRRKEQPGDLVASFARAHGVIDLAPDDDTRLLAAKVAAGCPRCNGRGWSPLAKPLDQRLAESEVTGIPLSELSPSWMKAPCPDCEGSGKVARVVLTVEEERAYKRLTDRVLAMFHLNDPLARFLYRGP